MIVRQTLWVFMLATAGFLTGCGGGSDSAAPVTSSASSSSSSLASSAAASSASSAAVSSAAASSASSAAASSAAASSAAASSAGATTYDDFESGSLSKWSVNGSSNGTVTLVADPTNSSNHVMQVLGSSGSVHAYANSSSVASLANYSVTFDMYIPSTVTAGKGIQIALRYVDANNYYGIEFFAGGNAYFFKKTSGSGQTWLPGGTATQLMSSLVGSATWETYKVTISGTGSATTLSLYRKVSGVFTLQTSTITDGTTTSAVAAGPFALIADQSPVTVLFDNIIYQ